MKIGLLCNYLVATDGVSNHLFHLVCALRRHAPEAQFVIIAGRNENADRFADVAEVLTFPELDHNARSVLNMFRAVRTLRRVIRERKLDILHAHTHYQANLGYYASRLSRCRTVQTVHGLIPPVGRLRIMKADHYILVNPNVANDLPKYGVSPGEFTVVRCGVPVCASSHPKPAVPPCNVIAAGRLIPQKGFGLYIDAVAQFPASIVQQCRFMLAGAGPAQDELLAQIRSAGNRVEYVGEISNLPEFLKSTHILVNPTMIENEGFPLTIIEAALTENCIVTARFDNLQSDFVCGTDGLAFEIGDTATLAKQLQSVITDEPARNRMAQSFAQKARTLYSAKSMVDRILGVYEKVLH